MSSQSYIVDFHLLFTPHAGATLHLEREGVSGSKGLKGGSLPGIICNFFTYIFLKNGIFLMTGSIFSPSWRGSLSALQLALSATAQGYNQPPHDIGQWLHFDVVGDTHNDWCCHVLHMMSNRIIRQSCLCCHHWVGFQSAIWHHGCFGSNVDRRRCPYQEKNTPFLFYHDGHRLISC